MMRVARTLVTMLAAGGLYLLRPELLGRPAAAPGPAPPQALERAAPCPRSGGWRRARKLAGAAVMLLAIAAWLLVLRPEGLGGPAGYVLVSGRSMEPTLSNGDLVVSQRQDAYAKGDVIVYRVPEGELGAGAFVIHRIVGGSGRAGYVTRGDNRRSNDLWRPKPRDVAGKLRVHLPRAGHALVWLRAPLPLALLAGAMAFLSVGNGSRRRV